MGIKRLSFPFTVLLVFVSCTITYFLSNYINSKIRERTNKTISIIEEDIGDSGYKINRQKGYRLIKPILLSVKATESQKYQDIKSKLNSYIADLKRQKKLISASVYLKDFDQGDWICINDTELYYPGSLIKVPGLITFLKMTEKTPGLLDKKFTFEKIHQTIPNQTYNSDQIQVGKSYSVRELLKYMISYSDNNATYLLNKNVDLSAFHQLFEDLDIPKLIRGNNQITTKNFSKFLDVLFNSSYLDRENSEFAVELLEACDFKLGMVQGLPVNTVVAHKFGEMGDKNSRQLHESGIIYINNNPYLLTIMTKGYDVKDLPEILSEMSRMVYQDFNAKALN